MDDARRGGRARCPVQVGTSGWQYRDWRGRCSPAGLPQRLWLEHHAAAFATTEVDDSSSRLPAREVFESWAARTPDDDVVTVKASRFLSHVERLQEPVARLMDREVAGHAGAARPGRTPTRVPDLPSVSGELLEPRRRG